MQKYNNEHEEIEFKEAERDFLINCQKALKIGVSNNTRSNTSQIYDKDEIYALNEMQHELQSNPFQ